MAKSLVNKTLIKIVAKKWKAVIVIVIAGAIFMAVLISKLVYELPERNLAEEFLYTNQKVQDYFGTLKYVADGESGSSVTYQKDGLKGYYTFNIEGEKASGEVEISWHSKREGSDFVVESIGLLLPGKRPKVLWSSE